MRGFIDGSRVADHDSVATCEILVNEMLVDNVILANNVTGTLLSQSSLDAAIYDGFDLALVLTKIAQQLHPVAFNCWNGADWIYEHFRYVIQDVNGYNVKPYILNLVYNFGHVFDSIRDFYLFMTTDPRG